jgi:hypothetical protein
MAIAEKWLGENCRKIFVFADTEAASKFQAGSWQAEAMKFLGVEILVISLAPHTKKLVMKAQRRQYMGNQPQ